MRIAIMDDDKEFSDKVQNMLNNISADKNISLSVDVYNNEEEFSKHIGKYELIMLDIEMPQIDGLELCDTINRQKNGEYPYVIFVSNKDNLVFKALNLIPYSFIRKCDIEFDLELRILSLYKRVQASRTVYTIKEGYDDVNLRIQDIIFLEKYKNYVMFHTAGNVYKERSKMVVKENELTPFGFARINVGNIVNIRHIVKVGYDNIMLKSGETLSVSKPYRADIKKKCSRFWGNGL